MSAACTIYSTVSLCDVMKSLSKAVANFSLMGVGALSVVISLVTMAFRPITEVSRTREFARSSDYRSALAPSRLMLCCGSSEFVLQMIVCTL
jgi:hypothetical protein